MRLLGLSDLHANHRGQMDALAAMPSHPADWLLAVGDLSERPEVLDEALGILTARFAKVIWVPGNHELWSLGEDAPRGVDKYLQMVDVCRAHGVHTPEDGWLRWPGSIAPLVIVPLFLLYDYSFGPDDLTPDEAIAWARESGIQCADEALLHPDPYPSRSAWCRARVAQSEALLATVPSDARTVLVNHWPLRRDVTRVPRVPRFVLWCGTRATEDWHRRYRAEVVVSGHLHVRATDWRDGVRFEEVSLGYPRDWSAEKGVDTYLREILPGPGDAVEGDAGPVWRR